MGLNREEANQFVAAFQMALAKFTVQDAQQPQANGADAPTGNLSGLLASAERLLNQASIIADRLIQAMELARIDDPDVDITSPPAPKKRGPKPKAPDAQSPAQSVASAASAETSQQTGLDLGIGPGVGGAPSEIVDDDPLGIGPAPGAAPVAPPPAPPQLDEASVKQTLNRYMQHHGTAGTAKLTSLLMTIAGVKQFVECPKDKWPAIMQAANAELKS